MDTYSAETCQAKYTDFVKDPEIVQINQDMLCAGNEHADTCASKVSSSNFGPFSINFLIQFRR